MWLNDIEASAMAQVYNLVSLPFAFKHIAVMPDAHTGYGMPIGTVLATTEQIIPNAVGVDIGCGMRAVRFPGIIDMPDAETLRNIMSYIRREVPVGAKKHSTRAHHTLMPSQNDNVLGGICQQEYSNAAKQLGTLGGGNHFIELQRGSDGHLWAMVHSGSRNLGHKVATYYNKLAIMLNKKYASAVPPAFELAHLPLDSQYGQDYIKEMNYCVEFAEANRLQIMCKVIDAVAEVLGLPAWKFDHIDVAHNYARQEHHFGKNVWVHRKGATSARDGEVGIIPGSQGTASYIVHGRGNPESFTSCSHGAGRTMSRSFAKKNLNLDDEIARLDRASVIHNIRTVTDLDEAPSAYKDIDDVMQNQADLVDVYLRLKPLAVVKG